MRSRARFRARGERSPRKDGGRGSSDVKIPKGPGPAGSTRPSGRPPPILAAQRRGREFLLVHRLFRSHRTGEVIHPVFLRPAFPPRWHYDVLRGLDHFQSADARRDKRLSEAVTWSGASVAPTGGGTWSTASAADRSSLKWSGSANPRVGTRFAPCVSCAGGKGVLGESLPPSARRRLPPNGYTRECSTDRGGPGRPAPHLPRIPVPAGSHGRVGQGKRVARLLAPVRTPAGPGTTFG
jgi:hypothetical protein